MSEYEPLHVSCYAFNEIVSDGALPLDGVLAYVWMREHHPSVLYDNSVAAKSGLIEADLSLKRIDNGYGWYYACSFCVTDWTSERIDHWHKRQDTLPLARYVGGGKLNIAQGRYKSYRMPMFKLLPGSRLHWYLVGDREWIAARLPLVTTLGKKGTAGNGVICDWQMESVAEDWSIIGPGGLMRAIPAEDWRAEMGPADVRDYGIRPPYWYRGNQITAAVPGIGYIDG